MRSSTLKYISLFSGIGGLDFGIEKAGFTNLLCVENDKDACDHLRLNTNWKIKESDITKLNICLVRKELSLRKKELDLIVGGPPCQSYSKSSFWNEKTKRGYADKRGKMIDYYMAFVKEFLPKSFLIENVPGFIYSKQISGYESLLNWLAHIEKISGVKYKLEYRVLNAVEFGVPQRRERLFIVANRLKKDFEFPERTHGDPGEPEVKSGFLKSYTTVADAFQNLTLTKEDLYETKVGGKWKGLLPCIPPGNNYQYFTDKGEGKESLFKYRSRFWTFLLKLSPKEPSWTIQASPGSATGPFHWSNRKLASRELARIQTIPDTVRFLSTRRVTQKLIGNAVPSALAEKLGKEIRKQIFDQKCSKRLYLIPKKTEQIYRPKISKRIPDQYLT